MTRSLEEMIEKDLKGRGIDDPAILEAFYTLDRKRFVPPKMQESAYMDGPLPIGYDQTISQPYIVALMTSLLALKKTDKVLEIGTGSGYQAAILAHVSGFVVTVERIYPLYKEGKKNLDSLSKENILPLFDDGTEAVKEHAPFDAIVLTAKAKSRPDLFLDALKEGGRLLCPLDEGDGERLTLYQKKEGEITEKKLSWVRFVPLIMGVKK